MNTVCTVVVAFDGKVAVIRGCKDDLPANKDVVEWLRKWNFQPQHFPSGAPRTVMFAPQGGYNYLHGERWATHDESTGISLVVKRG